MENTKRLIEAYYNRGEFNKCLSEIERELKSLGYPEKKELVAKELVALEGWCYYRKGEYGTARKKFKEAKPVDFAKEGLAYLAVYIDKDDETFRELAQELGDRVNIQNALTIRARDLDSSLATHEEILEGALRFKENEVEVANLYHNAGRFFLHKARTREDLLTALGLLDVSLARYGKNRNWHHRGAANFWKSKVLESLLDKRGALEAARESLYCWTEQMILDPATDRHKQKWEEAVNHIRRLLS